MSANASNLTTTESRSASWLERLSVLQIVLGIVISVAAAYGTVMFMQGATATRLYAVEEQVKENKADFIRILSEIRDELKEIRQEQLRQAREKR